MALVAASKTAVSRFCAGAFDGLFQVVSGNDAVSDGYA